VLRNKRTAHEYNQRRGGWEKMRDEGLRKE
jgi:hypothetical protein